MTKRRRGKILVLLAPGFEEVDVTAMTSILRYSGLPVALAGLTAGPVRGAYGLSLVPDVVLSEIEAEQSPAVVLPSGLQAARRLNAEPRVHFLLHQILSHGGLVVALDQAYLVLRQAGLLENLVADEFSPQWQMETLLSERVIVSGSLIFGKNSGTAQETALTLIATIEDRNRTGRSGRNHYEPRSLAEGENESIDR